MESRPVVFVWPGDLHLESADRPNYKTALWMANEVNELVRPDFVQFAGDNVQHAREPEWALFHDVTSKLKVPFHALVGDHDAHHDPGCQSFQAHVGATHYAFSVEGYRFICLNTMEYRPLGLNEEQIVWFRYEIDAALVRGERVVVFQHHYPFKVCEEFNGPGIQAWREIVQTRPIVALFSGHTHYGQIANDGRHLYVATRSIGDPEGGPAGYAVVYLDDEDLALTYRSVDDRGPIALITRPRRLILATKPAHIVAGPAEAQVRGWSSAKIESAEARIDGDPWKPMRAEGEMKWSFPIPGNALTKGEHALEVRLTDTNELVGNDRIAFLCDLSARYTAYPTVDPIVRETKFC